MTRLALAVLALLACCGCAASLAVYPPWGPRPGTVTQPAPTPAPHASPSPTPCPPEGGRS